MGRFRARWEGRFDSVGRLIVAAAADAAAAAGSVAAPGNRIRLNWEGSFFLYSSLALVNRELALALIDGGRCERADSDDTALARQDPIASLVLP